MNGGRARETVQKLWSASRSLQGGGVSYYEYVTELTYLLLLKMLEEVKRQGKPLEERLPAKYRWRELKRLKGEARLKHYRQVLQGLGDKRKVNFDLVNQIYKDAKTSLTKAAALTTLVDAIDEVDWYGPRRMASATCMRVCWKKPRRSGSRKRANISRRGH